MKSPKKKKKSFYIQFINTWKKCKSFFITLLFPDNLKCIFCGSDIPDFAHTPYCNDCEKELSFNISHRCTICDQPIFNEANVCDFCLNEKRHFTKLYAPFTYEKKIKNAIYSYKASNQRWKAKAFAKLIVDYIGKDKLNLNYITYIPLTKKKLRKRTFNQSQLLAEEIGNLLNVPVISMFTKNRDSKSQKKMNFSQRRKNIIGMYSLKEIKLKKTDNIMIVDDVVTTCATVSYCSGLLSSKVDKIFVCCLAREYIKNKQEIPIYNKFKNLK